MFTQTRGFFSKQDITFETKKVVPYSRQHFFEVIKDVEAYQEFIPWVTQSRILPETVIQTADKGRFDGEVKIGFSTLCFAYVSRVSYERDKWILSEAGNSRVFDGLYSHWKLQKLGEHECEIAYNIKMTFVNPLYTAVTTQFFDYLANNINKAFEKRCHDKYYKEGLPSLTDPVEQKNGSPRQTQEISDRVYIPDDNWIWEVGTSRGRARNNNGEYKLQQIQKARKELIDSIQSLVHSGLMPMKIDVESLLKALESQEDLYRELKTLHEAFGGANGVYAKHVTQLMLEHGCVLAK